jgi:DNA polymerase-3 subunit gamma/tau
MPAQALYRKWRPQLWEEVVGQDHVVQTLRNALRSNRMTHAYLFAGPRGCGKTTTARLVAKALNCLHPDPAQRPDNTCGHCVAVNEGRFLDLIEIDGASNNGVENIRELRDKINFAPSEGRFKVYLIDEVHMLSLGAFNALLKTLEEPPPHAVFILATTEGYKIPATVASRCQRFEFRRIPVAEMVARLKALCEQEGLTVEEAALEVVARQATGSLRDAISLLDQLVSADAAVTLAQAQALLGTAAGQAVQALAEALAAGDATAGLSLVHSAVDAGADPRQLARQMVDYLRGLMLVRLGSAGLVEAPAEVRALMARQAEGWELPALLRAVRAFNTAANDAKGGWQPQLPLELAVVECAALPQGADPEPAAASAPQPAGVPPQGRPANAVTRPSASTPEAIGAAELKAAWQRLIQVLLEGNRITKLTATGLEQCQIEGLEGNLLRVSTQSRVFLEKFEARPEMYKVMGEVLSDVLGFPCGLKFQLAAGRGGRSRGVRDVPPDGMVATALRDLGGQIVE